MMIRPMTNRDLVSVMTIQKTAYEARYHEDEAVFADNLHRFPEGCMIAELGGRAVGYLFSHPWCVDAPPLLNQPLHLLSKAFDCRYIHDLAVEREAQGIGLGRRIVEQAVALARINGHKNLTLTAVQLSIPFWMKLGFMPVLVPTPKVKESLESHGKEATYMIAHIG